MSAPASVAAGSGSAARTWAGVAKLGRRHPTAALGLVLLCLMAVVALLAPWLGTTDPVQIDPLQRLRPPSATSWFGTDMFGRDVYSRTVYGTRVSLFVGLSVAALSIIV